jgi:hypothetical protein
MNLSDLIGAIASYVGELHGSLTKTKLLKLLYLLDIESYRKTRTTLTGFNWTFYLYGPWSPQYEDSLAAAVSADRIRIAPPAYGDDGATFINPTGDKIPLSKPFPNVVQELSAKRIVEAWADRPTGELLDYVYFHTAPMRDAKRNEPINFATVLDEEPLPLYKRPQIVLDEKKIKETRAALLKRIRGVEKAALTPLDPAPKYDDEYWNAIRILESDVD